MAWTIGRKKYDHFGENIGIKIPKKSIILVQIHYETIGKKIIDRESRLEIKFHSKPPKHQKALMVIIDTKINIPPNEPNYLHEMRYKTKRDFELDSVTAHMHLGGKASSISIRDPEGKEKKIIRWDPYYYKFQDFYMFKNPLSVQKGSTIICRNWFDNSAGNPINPNPIKSVGWGHSSEKEMSACLFYWLIPSSADPYRPGFF